MENCSTLSALLRVYSNFEPQFFFACLALSSLQNHQPPPPPPPRTHHI